MTLSVYIKVFTIRKSVLVLLPCNVQQRYPRLDFPVCGTALHILQIFATIWLIILFLLRGATVSTWHERTERMSFVRRFGRLDLPLFLPSQSYTKTYRPKNILAFLQQFYEIFRIVFFYVIFFFFSKTDCVYDSNSACSSMMFSIFI